jgi:hypothetical protein
MAAALLLPLPAAAATFSHSLFSSAAAMPCCYALLFYAAEMEGQTYI